MPDHQDVPEEDSNPALQFSLIKLDDAGSLALV